MLGNEADARFIRDWHFDTGSQKDAWGDRTQREPEGWKRLGAGCYRVAYLSPDGVVYKVQQHYAKPGQWQSQSNKGEAETLRRYWLTKMPKGCRLPRWGFFELDGRGVVAMELLGRTLSQVSQYSPEGSRYWGALGRLQDVMRDVYDLHGGNLAVDEENQKLVPIDLGG